MRKKQIKFFIFLSVLLISCGQINRQVRETEYAVPTTVEHAEWAKDAVIYEVNIRQYSEEGTFNAFAEHLPRLKELGVDILWLMPVFPIGELNRKASQTVLVDELEDPEEKGRYLGSYYATSDYLSVNPEFGTPDDFGVLVDKIHELGMYVILDIAANHTAWDHPWVKTHPEYYTRIDTDSLPWNKEWMREHPEFYSRLKKLGMTYPFNPDETDWWDTAELNYDNEDMRDEMKKVFRYWVAEYDVDGYRCDVAGGVPCDFWNEVRAGLDSIKPVFMLAEDEAH
ncbi:MAG: alpha-amylase family glycosyl hydrolase, partial [Bacteroidales bacterium]